uniref:Uncharacterized protein n=1 Tax=Scylla paramamosain TaxID=85552 RepID=D2DSZ2_SCYPA|nr:hypothetical protein [Scylla paramamosain]
MHYMKVEISRQDVTLHYNIRNMEVEVSILSHCAFLVAFHDTQGIRWKYSSNLTVKCVSRQCPPKDDAYPPCYNLFK